MSLTNGQKANQITFNAAYGSKTVDDTIASKWTFSNVLNSTSSTTGAVKYTGGIGIAKDLFIGGKINALITKGFNKIVSQLDIVAGGTVTISDEDSHQVIRVKGNGLAVTLADTPFGNAGTWDDGIIVELEGQSDVDTVKLLHKDIQYGCIITGDQVLSKYRTLIFRYNKNLERFIINGRNY